MAEYFLNRPYNIYEKYVHVCVLMYVYIYMHIYINNTHAQISKGHTTKPQDWYIVES